ncbi:MAG: hypothetical protein EA397_03685 [Deltaproteobacteria bacterium]|nr:MAG: hypothetical protein EA397_03685 [Deltaproteobacteria bacterium]
MIVPAALLLGLVACPDSDPSGPEAGSDPGAQLTPQHCGNVGLDHLWRMVQGLPPLLDQWPEPERDWSFYGDAEWPHLTFMFPSGWVAHRERDSHSLGVNVVRNDGGAMFRRLYVVYPNPELTSQQVVNLEREMWIPAGTPIEVLCQDTINANIGGIGQDATIMGVRAGGDLIWFAVNILYDPGTMGYGVGAAMNISIDVYGGPEPEFRRLAEDVFIPIIAQMWITPDDRMDQR